MKVAISRSEIKRRNLLYYVNCVVEFNEVERAIIRERSLTGNQLYFEKGYVNYPPQMDTNLHSGKIHALTRVLFIVSLPLLFFIPFLGIMGLVGTVLLFIYRKKFEKMEGSSYEHVVKIRDLLDGKSFSVMAFDAVVAHEIEAEIREVLEGFKRLLMISAEIPKPQTFEI